MSLSNLSEKQLLIFTAVVDAVLALVLGLFVFLGHSALSQLHTELNKLQGEKNTYQARARQIPVLRERLEKMKKDIEKLEHFFPKKEMVTAWLHELIELAKRTGLEPTSFDRKEERVAPGVMRAALQENYQKITYDTDFKGNFHEMADFLTRIEDHGQFKRFMAVEDLSVKARDGGLVRGDAAHEIKLKLQTYRYEKAAPPPAPPAAPAAAKKPPTKK